jgi:hypothetical protein
VIFSTAAKSVAIVPPRAHAAVRRGLADRGNRGSIWTYSAGLCDRHRDIFGGKWFFPIQSKRFCPNTTGRRIFMAGPVSISIRQISAMAMGSGDQALASSARGWVTRVLGTMAAVSLLSAVAASAQTGTPPSKGPAPAAASPPVTQQSPEAKRREAWRATIARTPHPKLGCFTAAYPDTALKEVPCTAAPNLPYGPASGLRLLTVGNGTDFTAEVTSGSISSATGSFDSVTGGTSVTGPKFVASCTSPVQNVPDTYALQLNTSPFTTSACSASPNPDCRGWQQFVYSSNTSKKVFMQYWLLKYNATCPTGWNSYMPSAGETDCFKNSSAVSVPVQTAADLHQISLTGAAVAGGTDKVELSTNGVVYSVSANDNVLDLAPTWRAVEYNIVGDGCGSQAKFSSGTTIVVRTTVHNGTTDAPSCIKKGFTGESNNLTLVDTPTATMGPSPAIVFKQSNVPGSLESCSGATGIGDTHLTTFNGLLYDFQASGDFVLAQAGPDFIVQTRQKSIAPTWPNASVNKAVATKIGSHRLALCLAPNRFFVNGNQNFLADGRSLLLSGGVQVTRRANVYFITGENGDSVRAELNATWINVAVGLGRSPQENVRGLLANAHGNVNDLAMRDGTVLTGPVSFDDLYHRYADSWRVLTNESLLSPCGGEVERGIPGKPFYADDLTAEARNSAGAICTAAGVKQGPLFDACMLDVAVLGNNAAARIFASTPAPSSVMPRSR